MKSLAKTSRTSANRIIVELIESGIEARQQERKRFLELADRLARSRDVEEQTRLKEELHRQGRIATQRRGGSLSFVVKRFVPGLDRVYVVALKRRR